MKKNLLTIGFLVLFIGLSKAQVLTYVDSGAKLYVGSSALVCSGGDFQLNSTNSATVENKGNITIVGKYLKGGAVNAATDGKGVVSSVSVTIYDSLEMMYGDVNQDVELNSKTGYFKYKREKAEILANFI